MMAARYFGFFIARALVRHWVAARTHQRRTYTILQKVKIQLNAQKFGQKTRKTPVYYA